MNRILNHRRSLYIALAALLIGLPALVEPSAQAMKKRKAGRKTPGSNGRRRNQVRPRANTDTAHLLRKLPEALRSADDPLWKELSELAVKYEKIPALGNLNPAKRITELCRQISSTSMLAVGILKQYAQLLDEGAEVLEVGVVVTQGEDGIESTAIGGRIRERPGLAEFRDHVLGYAAHEQTRSKVADKFLGMFGSLDENLRDLHTQKEGLKTDANKAKSSRSLDIDHALGLVETADRIIAAGTELMYSLPDKVLLTGNKRGEEPTVTLSNGPDADAAESVQSLLDKERKAYQQLFSGMFENRKTWVVEIVDDARAWRRQIRQWAGLPDGQFVFRGDAPEIPNPAHGSLGQQLEAARARPRESAGKDNRGRYQKQEPIDFAERLVADVLAQVEDLDKNLANQMRLRAKQGPHRALAEKLGLGDQDSGHQPNKSPVYRMRADAYTEVHELFAERAMMLLNSLAKGEVGQRDLGLSFSASNSVSTVDGNRIVAKTIRNWDDRSLLSSQVPARGGHFWRRFFVDPPVGRQQRILAGPAHRAAVELLVEKRLRKKLSKAEQESIGSEYRPWVPKQGIPFDQILGVAGAPEDQRADLETRMSQDGPRFAEETDVVLQELMRTPPPAFKPFVEHLEGRNPHIVWDAQTRTIALDHD